MKRQQTFQNENPKIYLVATPIGNLGDITVRVLETFKTVDVIAAEDTRHTLQLLTHFEIRKPLISCRAQNEEEASKKVIALLGVLTLIFTGCASNGGNEGATPKNTEQTDAAPTVTAMPDITEKTDYVTEKWIATEIPS